MHLTFIEDFQEFCIDFYCGFWRYQTLSETFLVYLAKAPFCQSGKLLEGKTFPRKIFFCLFLVHFRPKIFTHRTKTFRQSSGIWVLRVQKKVFEEKIPGKNCFQHRSEYQRKVLRLSAFFFDMLFTNFIYHFQSSMSVAKNVWEEKEFCIFFTISSGIISPFGQNSWGSIDKTAFFVPREKLRMILFVKKSNFSNSFCLWAEEFRTSREKIRQSAQNCVMRVLKSFQ